MQRTSIPTMQRNRNTGKEGYKVNETYLRTACETQRRKRKLTRPLHAEELVEAEISGEVIPRENKNRA